VSVMTTKTQYTETNVPNNALVSVLFKNVTGSIVLVLLTQREKVFNINVQLLTSLAKSLRFMIHLVSGANSFAHLRDMYTLLFRTTIVTS
jgi:hypothetical protein